jgi:hypothetical protein
MLYELASNQNVIVAQIIGYYRFCLTSIRPLNDILHEQLFSLYRSLLDITLNLEFDISI